MKYRPTPHFLAAIAVVLSLVSFVSFAHDANVSWRNATSATDGTTLPSSGDDALRDTRVRYGTCNAAKDAIAVHTDLKTVPSSQTSLLVSGLPDGTFCFQAQHSTNGDVESAWTKVVSKEFVKALKKPRLPQNVVIQ